MRTIIEGKEIPKIKLLSRAALWGDTAILVYLALVKLVIHLLTANNYGYFVDEFYWLAMAKHLDFGYVDVPPLVAYVGAVWRLLFGASLVSIHILPALAGAVMVFCAGLTARELGGGRFAQGFTALMVLTAPWWLAVNSWFAYDPFDQLCSVILFYLFVRLINEETPGRWIGLGLMAGLGIMTKLTMIFTVGALALGLLMSPGLASPGRKSFGSKWPWLAVLIGVLLCTPYIIWQAVHGWPLITYWRGYAVSPFRPHFGPLIFLWELFLFLNPVVFPMLLLGLFYLLFHREGGKYRPLGLSFLILAVFYISQRLDARLLVSACLPLLAAGAIWLEKIIPGAVPWKGAFWFRRAYLGFIAISGLLLAPLFLPVLPIGVLEKYAAATPKFIAESLDYRQGHISRLFAFRFGWPELVRKVAEIHHGLPEADRKKCVIWTEFYSQAGAIDLLGKKYGLPNAISTNLSYYFWGTDPERRGADPEVVIVLCYSTLIPYGAFDEVKQTAFLTGNPRGTQLVRYQSIYVCRKPKRPFKEIWPSQVSFW